MVMIDDGPLFGDDVYGFEGRISGLSGDGASEVFMFLCLFCRVFVVVGGLDRWSVVAVAVLHMHAAAGAE